MNILNSQKTVEKLTISTVQGEFKNNFLEINGYENVAKIQDKKINTNQVFLTFLLGNIIVVVCVGNIDHTT